VSALGQSLEHARPVGGPAPRSRMPCPRRGPGGFRSCPP
jgi:hypothetical protein